MTNNSALADIEAKLSECDFAPNKYLVPSLWIDPFGEPGVAEVEPVEFYKGQIAKIRELSDKANPLSAGDVTYNMLVRFSAAFDSDGDGKINPAKRRSRETGTFLKALAMTPYIRSLGANIVYLLPVASIGEDGKKGALGSPYAIKNPYELDERLAEPFLGSDVETEFKAFIEAAHMLGMKVVLEFVFRTASVDGDWALERPEWFYWIKNGIQDRPHGSDDENLYGSPIFSEKELDNIKSKVEAGDYKNLPEPSRRYREFFTEPPRKVSKQGKKLVGKLEDGIEVRVPSAFADWPPDDLQPPWSDVTYLKMYEDKKFNYIAYNTARMYDEKLAKSGNPTKELWRRIEKIIPHYQEIFGVDGVLVDMGHALPRRLRAAIVEKAREANPEFIFWEENFKLTKESVEEGYNAAVGYLPFDADDPEKLNALVERLAGEGSPIPFFLTAETHNTPRAAMKRRGGKPFSEFAWLACNFLPGLLFVHSGVEFYETTPVNTGLCFTKEEIERFPAEKLPLFSEAALDWTGDNMLEYMREILALRRKYLDFSSGEYDLKHIEQKNAAAVVFLRKTKNDNQYILIAGNLSAKNEIEIEYAPDRKFRAVNLLNNSDISIENGELERLKIVAPPMGKFCGLINEIKK